MFLDTLFHVVVDIGKSESLFLILPLLNPSSDLAAFISLCSIQMSHHSGTRPFMRRVMDNMVPMGCKTFNYYFSLYSGEVSSCFISWKYSRAPLAY